MASFGTEHNARQIISHPELGRMFHTGFPLANR